MIDTNKFILLPVEQVEKELKSQGFETCLVNNNFNVIGDKKLVTNVVISNTIARIYYGEFIFDLEGKNET